MLNRIALKTAWKLFRTTGVVVVVGKPAEQLFDTYLPSFWLQRSAFCINAIIQFRTMSGKWEQKTSREKFVLSRDTIYVFSGLFSQQEPNTKSNKYVLK